MKWPLFLLFACILVLTSCAKEDSKNVEQDSIYTIYELFYNKNADQTKAQATFRFGGPTGTLLKLSNPANCTFNNDNLNYNQIVGFHQREYAGFKSSGTFTYTDTNKDKYTNSTATIIPLDFPSVDTIDTNNAFTLKWTGSPIADGETISLTIDGTQQNNFEIETSSSIGATELVFPANKLQKLGKGNATCTLIRAHNRLTVDEGTSKGGRMAVWYTTNKTIFINN